MQNHTTPQLQLPWNASQADDDRFRRMLLIGLGVLFVLSIAVPFIPVPEETREEQEALPPQLARVIIEKEEVPPPPIPEPEPEPEEPEAEPEDEPEPEPEPEKEPEPEPEPEPDLDKARETAKVSGLLQFQDALMDMREAIDMDDVQSNEITQGAAEAESTDRSIITSGATTGSGGINTAALSKNTGGVALSGRETTTVASPTGITGTGDGNSDAESNRKNGQRSGEEVRKAIERHKGAIFSIYQRELRKNPALQGKMILSILISPNGRVKDVSIILSDLDDKKLEAKVLARVRLINFPARTDVAESRVEYTFNFLP